jgi:hypothetical protein
MRRETDMASKRGRKSTKRMEDVPPKKLSEKHAKGVKGGSIEGGHATGRPTVAQYEKIGPDHSS